MTMKFSVGLLMAACILGLSSCGKKTVANELPLQTETKTIKSHKWFYFSESGLESIDLPQNAPAVSEKPWTEAIRVSSAASVIPSKERIQSHSPYQAFALLNRKGILCINEDKAQLYTEDSFFARETADQMVFSNGHPVFYLYRSTFFNDRANSPEEQVSPLRPFLVEMNPDSKVFFPLVSYRNLGLETTDQITGFIWDGTTWACSAKKVQDGKASFSYFYWQPLVPLADLSPALGQETFLFNSLDEEKFRQISTPKYISKAPEELKKLVSSIPQSFSYYVVWRDESGTSPISYAQMGDSDYLLTASGSVCMESGLSCCVFQDGTTYVKISGEEKVSAAFRLPRLPRGFTYGEQCIAGKTLWVAWEESTFYKTRRAGMICVNLGDILQL